VYSVKCFAESHQHLCAVSVSMLVSMSCSYISDGRDNQACCKSQNVPNECLDYCYSSADANPRYNLTCLNFIREISKCEVEGLCKCRQLVTAFSDARPGPPRFLRHLVDGPKMATIRWDKPYQTVSIDYYEVHLMNGSEQIVVSNMDLSLGFHLSLGLHLSLGGSTCRWSSTCRVGFDLSLGLC
jgi:DB module